MSFSTDFLINDGADSLSSLPCQGDPAGKMRQGRDKVDENKNMRA